MIPAVDLFSGLGGFTEGAHQTGRVSVKLAANHWAGAVEFHLRNHPELVHECQDLMHIDWRILPDIRAGLLLASPACQGHSTAGQPASKGTGGSHAPNPRVLLSKHQADRNTAWAVLACLDTARPAAAIIENVVPFQRWSLFEAWVGMIGAMGYHTVVHTLNGRHFGSAQDRPRTIITASLKRPIHLAEVDGGAPFLAIGDCLDADELETNRWAPIETKPARVQRLIRRAQQQAGSRCFWNNVSESRGRALEEPFPTVTTQSGSQFNLVDGERVRVLNPRELARAQGFPERYQIPANRKLASKLIGNAIDVHLARAIVSQVVAA